ncbi:hypothetical protein IFR04_003566 [Cadophora malorum]|uniref:N-acetyltransferase domain-containing protein n=1 Tax=Cadophora malorum TaxID=108018 RepID=A0A8H7WEF8_9HELO|nr:hypothetical protein IFR04_003566 [Cadophora malorum]
MSNQRHDAEETDEMSIDSGATSLPPPRPPTFLDSNRHSLAIISRDSPDWLGYIRALQETDVIILLTPVVIPISHDPTDTSDPFEPFGRALAKRHSRIRHVPYTRRNGITSTHLGFIKRGHIIVLCFAISPDLPLQLEIADITFAVSDNKPCIVVICSDMIDTGSPGPFPTIVQAAGYSPPALEAAAALVFGENLHPQAGGSGESSRSNLRQPRLWLVDQWNEARDLSRVLDLWTECVSSRFALDQQTLASLLRRPGYAKHYVVRDSSSRDILGFCATYLSYMDQEGERLIASVAFLFVQREHREQGIGLSLHSHAISELKKTRGVVRLQLGSTFPRILYGPPLDIPLNDAWFRRRGWPLSRELPGQGRVVYDLILNFPEWRYKEDPFPPTTPSYRPCTQADMGQVLELVARISFEQVKMGWFDQYLSLMNGPNVKDVILGFADNAMVATALTYTPSCGSQISSNLPWASQVGNDVGGVACICVHPNMRHLVMGGLLDACVETLHDQGMKRMFADGIGDEADGFLKLGFRKWAQYRDVWKDT